MTRKIWLAFLADSTGDTATNNGILTKQYIGAFAGNLPEVRAHLIETYGPKINQISIQDLNDEVYKIPAAYEGLEAVPIEDLNLSNRSYNALKRIYLFYMGDIMGKTFNDFMKIKAIGRQSAEEIVEKRNDYLAAHGYEPQPAPVEPKKPMVIRWPKAHVGQPTREESRAKKEFFSLCQEDQEAMLSYFPDFHDLVEYMNRPEEERLAELKRCQELPPSCVVDIA